VTIDAPEYLQLPLEDNKAYSIPFLKAFLARHRIRVAQGKKRADYIKLIVVNLGDYLLPVVDNNLAVHED
jgi:hypothetical protein